MPKGTVLNRCRKQWLNGMKRRNKPNPELCIHAFVALLFKINIYFIISSLLFQSKFTVLEIEVAFSVMDSEGRGKLTANNLKTAMNKFGIKCGDEDADRLIKTFDADGQFFYEKHLTFFVIWCNKYF